MNTSERLQNTCEAQEHYNQSLHTLVAVFDEYGVTMAPVGGSGLCAAQEKNVDVFRDNGTIRDFDGIVWDTPSDVFEAAMAKVRVQNKYNPYAPDLGIESVIQSDDPLPYGVMTMMTTMRQGSDGSLYLVYRDIEQLVPPATMQTQPRTINDVTFQCLPAETLWWRYYLRGGNLKPKDGPKLDTYIETVLYPVASQDPMAQYEEFLNSNEFPENPQEAEQEFLAQLESQYPYSAYVQFLSEINLRYPRRIKLFNAFWWLDQHLPFGGFSGSSALHSWKDLFNK